MYNPKDIFTEGGLEEYNAHLYNIKAGLFYIQNNVDDLHIGATDSSQEDDLYTICEKFEKLLPVLKVGDGEKGDE